MPTSPPTQSPTVHCAEHLLPGHDGQELFVRHYSAPDREATRTVLIAHGVSEHGGRYDHVARELVEKGWTVIVGDHRGHGRSAGVPVHVDRFDEYIHDLERIRAHFALQPEHTALLAHSMGGLVAIRYVQSCPGNLAALVLMSPLLEVKVEIPRATVAVGRLISFFAPRFRFRSRVDINHTTRNQAILRKREADELIHQSLTAGWFFAMRSALQAAWERAGEIDIPVLLMQAGDDRIVCPRAAENWLGLVGSADKSFRLLPDHLHEILNEPGWRTTLAEIADWLDHRIPVSTE